MTDHRASEITAGSGTPLSPLTTKRRPVPRKGHTKSRAGCFICKKRKVKCDEVAPECGPCHRLGLDCEYRQKNTPTSPRSTPSSTAVSRPLRSTPAMFNADDLNFFRHFLFEAYPPLPIDGFVAWQDASRLSHEYNFLLHAMLGLGASHLSLLSPADYRKAALKHRVSAIQSLNEHLSKPSLSMAESDAAFGAMLALTFQAAYMADGLFDFLTMVRGCFLIGTHLMPDMDRGIFRSFARAKYIEKIRELVQYSTSDHHLDIVIAEEFCHSTKQIGPLCKSIPELRYLAHMQKIAQLAVTDPTESFRELSFFYDALGDLTSRDFASFIDPDNHVSQLVIMHMLVLDYVMSRKSIIEGPSKPLGRPGSSKGYDCRKGMSKIWIEQMLERLPPDYHKYAEWPVNFSRGLSYSFDQDDEVWRPFLLSNGQATLATNHLAVLMIEDLPDSSTANFLDHPITPLPACPDTSFRSHTRQLDI